MKFRIQIPRVAASGVEDSKEQGAPVLDGRDILVPNRWNLPAHTVAMVGRPAVWIGFTLLSWHVERDIGGHLYLLVTGADPSHAQLVEAGPRNPNGTGALVPFTYPEVDFADRQFADFAPEVVAPPNGMPPEAFANAVRATHRAYDGNQRYRAIEMPFLRVGRDSNSYVVGVLLASGVDPRAIPRGPKKAIRRELAGYPGAEDPVPKANFGVYVGAPTPLADGVADVAYHDERGDVRAVVVGGAPHARVRLPDGAEITLDEHGRCLFDAAEAKAHALPQQHTEPPESIRTRPHFPEEPDPAGGLITLLVAGRAVPLVPGSSYRGTVVARNDALGAVTIAGDAGTCVLPITDLGAELRDPKRVDELFRVGNDLTVGLHRDRHPRLVVHGTKYLGDRLKWRRFHAPRPLEVVGIVATSVVGLAAIAGAIAWYRTRPR